MKKITVYLYAYENNPVQRGKLMMPKREEIVLVISGYVPGSHWWYFDALCDKQDAYGEWSPGLLPGPD